MKKKKTQTVPAWKLKILVHQRFSRSKIIFQALQLVLDIYFGVLSLLSYSQPFECPLIEP